MPSFYGSLSVTAVVDTAPLDAMSAAMPGRMDKILAEVCAAIEADVKSNITRQHVIDTGNLLNSIHFERMGDLQYLVSDGTDYGAFQELGTRFIVARPFFIPGVEHNADLLVSKVPSLFK